VITVNGVEILLIIGIGIAVSAIARRRGIEPGLMARAMIEDIDLRQAARNTAS
jgi:hypothetical protein